MCGGCGPLSSRRSITTEVITISNIIDTYPEREKRILARPSGIAWLSCHTTRQELVNLITKRKYSRLIGSYKRRVDCRSAVCVVVGQDERFVVDGSVYIDPVRSTDSSVALVVRRRGISQLKTIFARAGDRRTGYGGFPNGFPTAGTVLFGVKPV